MGGVIGEITSGKHNLTQSDFHAALSGANIGGGIGRIVGDDENITLTQTDCTFHLTNLTSGAAGISHSQLTGHNGRVILTQANVSVTEAERAEDTTGFGGSVGDIVGDRQATVSNLVVLTQTAVNINLNTSNNFTRQDEGAAFAHIARNASVILRLFSGTSNVNACGTITPVSYTHLTLPTKA